MRMRTVALLLAAAAAVASAAKPKTKTKSKLKPPPPPHIFFCLVDDLGHADVGYSGGPTDCQACRLTADSCQ